MSCRNLFLFAHASTRARAHMHMRTTAHTDRRQANSITYIIICLQCAHDVVHMCMCGVRWSIDRYMYGGLRFFFFLGYSLLCLCLSVCAAVNNEVRATTAGASPRQVDTYPYRVSFVSVTKICNSNSA